MTGLLSGAAVIPESITGLAQGVIKTMLLNSLKLSGIVVLLAAGVLGTVVVAQQGKNDGGDGGAQTTQNPAPRPGPRRTCAQVERASKDWRVPTEMGR